MIDVLGYASGMASRSQQQKQFESQHELAKQQFAEAMREFGLQLGFSKEQQDQKIKEFNAQLKLEADKLAQQGSQFSKSLSNTKAQQNAENLMKLSQITGAGAANVGQANVISKLGNLLGVPTSGAAILNSGTSTGTAPGQFSPADVAAYYRKPAPGQNYYTPMLSDRLNYNDDLIDWLVNSGLTRSMNVIGGGRSSPAKGGG